MVRLLKTFIGGFQLGVAYCLAGAVIQLHVLVGFLLRQAPSLTEMGPRHLGRGCLSNDRLQNVVTLRYTATVTDRVGNFLREQVSFSPENVSAFKDECGKKSSHHIWHI